MNRKRCNERYTGETARNAFTRGREHMSGIIKKSKDSVFHLHNIQKHNGSGNVSDYEMKVTKYIVEMPLKDKYQRQFRFNTPRVQ